MHALKHSYIIERGVQAKAKRARSHTERESGRTHHTLKEDVARRSSRDQCASLSSRGFPPDHTYTQALRDGKKERKRKKERPRGLGTKHTLKEEVARRSSSGSPTNARDQCASLSSGFSASGLPAAIWALICKSEQDENGVRVQWYVRGYKIAPAPVLCGHLGARAQTHIRTYSGAHARVHVHPPTHTTHTDTDTDIDTYIHAHAHPHIRPHTHTQQT